MNFEKVEKKYRPIPFWSWNEKLDTETTREQVRIMDKAGVGGYFMHARGGLLTEYMGEEWFENINAAADEGAKCGMYSWAYDENGWPSGFGGGKVNGLGEDYQQKTLHIEPLTEENKNAERTVMIKDGYRYFYKVNQFYVDVLDKKVTEKFIEVVYVEYAKRMGDKIEGFFTDEPQISRFTGYPWSFPYINTFKEKYGYDLMERLDELFFDVGNYKQTRIDYWKLVTELFSENFFKPIYDWCVSNNYQFTGHLVCEENLFSQLCSNGAAMPHYEYFTIPGMDWLGRPIVDCMTPVALGSVAAQTGKKQVLSETFALAGHNVSHAELKRIYEWQMVRGVNLLCTHLEGYSLRGIRKRDYPPAMYYQQPWWDDMDIFFDSMSRVGKMLAEGAVVADTLLIHSQTTAWTIYNGGELANSKEKRAEIDKYSQALIGQMKALEEKHVLYHLGDEIMMERHGCVKDGKLVIGKMAYSKVIIPDDIILLPNTKKLLSEFVAAGGVITTVEDIEANPITEISKLTYTKRVFDGFEMHYFVNTSAEEISATINEGNLVFDITTGKTSDFSGEYTFAPYESLVLIENFEGRKSVSAKKTTPLSLLGDWSVKSATYNSITLDRCDYSVDGGEIFENTYVLDILPRLNELRRPAKLWQKYTFSVQTLPNDLFLCTETPEIFKILVNGQEIDKTERGCFRDMSFKLIDIAPYAKCGENTVEFYSTITQSDRCYKHLSNSWEFESMKNSLAYDMEIEQIYIVGSFGAIIDEPVSELELEAYRIKKVPTIAAMPTTVDVEKLDMSGFPEFSGTLTLERTFDVSDTAKSVTLVGRGMNSVHVSINGREVAAKMFPPYSVDVSEYLNPGENKIELTLVNNLRNMQGPFHLKIGECTFVGPFSFFRESNVFRPLRHGVGESCHDVLEQFDEDICLVHYGLKG